MGLPPVRPPSKALVVAAFAAVYLIWGSTYLAIRFAVETLPPFTMAGLRHLVAGGILYAVSRRLGVARPARAHWRSSIILGAFLLLGGNGGVTWAEQTVPSGIAALLVATMPLWMLALQWMRRDGRAPEGREVVGIVLGFGGVVILLNPWNAAGQGSADIIGMLVLIGAALSWAYGSLLSRNMPVPASPWLTTAMQMLCGSVLLLGAGLLTGEWGRISFHGVSAKSVLAFVYLVLAGSLVGFTAYVWLLRVTTPAKVGTYAYVNPVVAVVLGYLLGNELLTGTTLIGMGVIVMGVLLTRGPRKDVRAAPPFVPDGKPRVVAPHADRAEVKTVQDEPVV